MYVTIKIEVDIPKVGVWTHSAQWPVSNLPGGHTHKEMAATVIHQFAETLDKSDAKDLS